MTTINELRGIVEYTRSLSNKNDKLSYLNEQSRDVLNFLSKNIKKDGIAKVIASEILNDRSTISSMEDVVDTFKRASILPGKLDKAVEMKTIILSPEDREFVLTTLYGSLKLGVTIPTPEPEFGDIIKPQLCGTGIKFDPKKYIIEEKFDGIRCIATKKDEKITLQSRNGKILNIPVIERSLINVLPDGTTVDGEIVASDGQFESLDRKSNNLIYVVFDIIFIGENRNKNLPLYSRKRFLDDLIDEYLVESNDLIKNDHVKISQTLNLNTIDEINQWVNKTGAEGIVAKNPNSLYQYGNRKDWIKVKLFMDCTCNVIDYTEGTGKRKGIMGAINVTPEGSSKVTKVGSGFTDAQLIKMKQLIDDGKKIKVDVKYQNLTNDGCLRFPIFLRFREIDGEEI